MNTIIAICYFALSLYGFDVGGNALAHRDPGAAGIARLQCLGSDGARCHYILFPRTTPPVVDRADQLLPEYCRPGPLELFAAALDADRRFPGLAVRGPMHTAAGAHPQVDCETPPAPVVR